MNHSIDLMQTDYYSLKEIAAKTGFSDYRYFLTQFKKFTGLSPTEYKNKT